MITQHPSQPGWLIITSEVQRLLNADWQIIGPDDIPRHPLHFTPPDFGPDDVELTRIWAISYVNNSAGIERTKYGTNIPFQGDVYQLKEKEALSYKLDNTPLPEKYPILYKEAEARNITVNSLADEYLQNAALFPKVIAHIESVRMKAITEIKKAATIQEIETALSLADWSIKNM